MIVHINNQQMKAWNRLKKLEKNIDKKMEITNNIGSMRGWNYRYRISSERVKLSYFVVYLSNDEIRCGI